MRKYILILGLLCVVASPIYAQNWTPKDSLRLQQMLNGSGELKLNGEVLEELKAGELIGNPKTITNKTWMDFDTSMPFIPKVTEGKRIHTLRPYTATTKFNWDPVYQRKVKIDKNTWRSDPFYEITSRTTYSNWAKSPLDAGRRKTLEQIEATGMRYRATERVNGIATPHWQKTEGAGIGGLDLMTPFTRDFWDFKGKKRRARTLEVLKAYGDSISVQQK